MTSEAGLLAGPFLSLKKGTRSVPKTSAAKMSLLIFIAESHDMHPNGVLCSKRRASEHPVILRAKPEDNSAGESCDKACFVITEPKSWGFSPIQSSFINELRLCHGGFSPIQSSLAIFCLFLIC